VSLDGLHGARRAWRSQIVNRRVRELVPSRDMPPRPDVEILCRRASVSGGLEERELRA